ncbi:MAG: hypothetical protein K6T73_10465 [Candidatus Bathyarchaeota archaeon]|nr:hypothetical protein [Candidatus Bathyarchaeota archaeon]
MGYTKGENARSQFFGSLVLAKDGEYIGCCGSGFNSLELYKVWDILRDAPRKAKPFPDYVVGEDYVAVDTTLRVVVKYYKQSDSTGVLRFPIFHAIFNA